MPAGFSAEQVGMRKPPIVATKQQWERLPVLFRHSKAVAVMQKVHRLTDN
jgi:hypothetical protein